MYVNAQKLTQAEAVHQHTIIQLILTGRTENVLKTVVMQTQVQAVMFSVITVLIVKYNNI